VQAAAVVIAADTVNVLASVATQAGELAAKFLALGVVWKMVMRSGHIADVDCDIPLEGRPTLRSAGLRLCDRFSEALPAEPLVCPDVRVTERPEAK
jgi:hypothetical protein